MRLRNGLCALALALAMPATATASDGFYLTLGAGAVFPHNSDIEGSGINQSVDLDMGWGVMGGVGYGYGNGFRSEVNLNYSDVSVDNVSGATGNGDVDVLNLMIDLLYDLDVGMPVTPYIGAGIGVARVDFDGISPVAGNNSEIDDEDVVFAYQGIAGLSYLLNEEWTLFADYRYTGTLDPGFTTNQNVDVDSEYADHRVMVGFRWFFGAPQKPMPATPVAAPAPAPVAQPKPPITQSFIVFFDHDKSTLTDAAKKTIQQAAEAAKKGVNTRIEATGHADRSGKDAYNQALSQKRVNMVRDALVKLGIASKEIATVARGESQPLVPTADGVKEPQNRRVEILLK